MHSLVTGAGGFLGQYIVEQLVARGDRVRTIARRRYAALEALDQAIRRPQDLEVKLGLPLLGTYPSWIRA